MQTDQLLFKGIKGLYDLFIFKHFIMIFFINSFPLSLFGVWWAWAFAWDLGVGWKKKIKQRKGENLYIHA